MTHTVNIILPTIRFLPVTRDIVRHVIGAAEDATDVHVTIADGQEDDQKKEWIVRQAGNLAGKGQFTYIGLKDATERLLRAAQLDTEWILPLSDDDPYSVNFVRSMCNESRTATSNTVAIAPSVYLSYSPAQLNLFRLQNIEEQEQGARLLSLYKQAHLNGIVTWCVIRRKPFLEWLEYLLTKAIWPTYADQLLVSYLAMKGNIVSSKEESFYAKDQRDWHDPVRAIIKDSGGYGEKHLTVFHEIFWISDLFTLLRSNGLEDRALPLLTFRAIALLQGGVAVFENRLRVLGIEQSDYSREAYTVVTKLAALAATLAEKSLDEHLRFFAQVQSVAAALQTMPEGIHAVDAHPHHEAIECTAGPTDAILPAVSVVIPCYNQAQYLPEAVESVARQTYQGWECVIVNDGSSDDTSEVARRVIAQYPDSRVRLIEKANGGLSDARNAGIKASTSKYILPLDADDRLAPTMLEKTVGVLEDQPPTGVAFTYIQHFGDQADVWRTGPFTLETELQDNRIPYCSLYRRDLFVAVGGYNTNLDAYEDWDFWLGALERGWTGALIPEPLFLYRKRANSMLAGANTRREQLCAQIRANHPRLFGESSVRPGHVLIVCTHFPPSVGGLETVAAQLGTSLIAKGYDVHVATERSEKREFKEYRGITIHSLDPVPVPGQRLPRAVQQLRELILSGRYDACILLADPRNWIFWSLEGFDVPEYTRIIAQPLVNTEGFAGWRENREFRTRLAQILKRAHSVVAISTGGAIVQYLTEEGIPYVYIPNAVERETGREGFRARYSIPESVPLLLHIANLWPVKNHLGLMDALSTMGGDWRLVMIGHSSGDSQYDRRVCDAVQRDPRFMLIPGLPSHEIAAALDTADVLLLGSHGEVAPVTVLEAMSHATPWLATPQCGGVHDNAGGLVAPIEEFPRALSWLLENQRVLQRLGRLGYEHWSECFKWDVVIKAWDDLIKTGTSSAAFAIPPRVGEEMQSIRADILRSIRAGVTRTASMSESGPPLVSVIVPTFNRPDTLIDALRSILNQTYKDFEIIVVNDAGSDVENVVRFLDKDSKITYIRHGSNRDRAAARNTAIKVARGKYIAYLDDDDIYYPDHLETLVTYLQKNGSKVAYTDAYRAHQEKRGGRYVITKRDLPYSFDFDYNRILVHNFIPILCLMHEKGCLDVVGLFDESLTTHEDWDLLIRLSKHFQIAHIRKVTCEFVSRTDGTTTSSSKLPDFSRTMAIVLKRHRVSPSEKPQVWAAQQKVLQRLEKSGVRVDDTSVKPWPQAVSALIQQADEHQRVGELQAAMEALGQALAILPDDSRLMVMMGNSLIRLGDVEGARREFVKATTLHPEYAPAHADLAAVRLHLGRTEEAEVSVRRALELDSTNVNALKVLAKICLDTERYQEAVQAYATILEHAPNDIETLILVGNCYAETGRRGEAKKFYQRVLQLDPGNAVASENLVIVDGERLSLTRTSSVVGEAVESERRHVTISTSDGHMPHTRFEASPESVAPDKVSEALRCAEVYLKNENLEAADQVLTEAVAQAPDNPDLIVASGHVAWKQGDLEKARLQFIRATTLDPNHVAAHTASAVLLLQQGQCAEAEEAARKALAIDAAELTALKVLAKICLDTERYQEAVQAYATILEHAPDDIETLILVGNCYAESGQFEQARSFYRKVLALDSGHTVAAENLVEVDRLVAASDGTTPEPMVPAVFEDRPSVSIVIITYNSASSIRACLDSILGESRPVTEVIVVDNRSTDETRSILREYEGRIATILNSENVGFSAACNQGIRASGGDYVVLLNPDTVVTSGWLDRLIAHIGPGVGAVGPVSDYAAELQNIDRNLPDGAPRRMGLAEVADLLGRANHGKTRETKLLTGFCLILPRRVLDEVGLLDEDLFLGNDDLDLSWRLRLKGYKLVVATDTFIHHQGQISFKSEAPSKTSRLVQESTDRLYAKLEAHYGVDKVPSPMELWGIDWFRPTRKTEVRSPTAEVTTQQAEGRRLKAESPLTPHTSRLTSIIILTHNGLEHIKKCLASIEVHTPELHELIIVDNASTDGTLDYLRKYMAVHDNVRVIANRTNRGFAAGNNQGLALARGDYLLLLNNDTIVTTGWLTRMLRIFEAHPDVGIVGPMSNYAVSPQLVEGTSYQGLKGLDTFAEGWAHSHDGQSRETPRIAGFCLLTRKEVIARVGGLDERFGSGNYEDDDFCIRAFLFGFRARIALDVFVHHTGSQTFKAAKIDYHQSLMRNWELFKTKWGIPADTAYESGYHFPSQSAQNVSLSIPLPDVGADHRCGGDGRWWQEIGEDLGRCGPATTGETRFGTLIISNGHGITPLWPSLVQHTNQPLAVTIVPSTSNGNGSTLPPQSVCPNGWQVGTADESVVRLLNRLLQSAGDDPVILLSGDVVVTPGWLKRLLAVIQCDQKPAAVGPTSNYGAAAQRVKADYKGTGKALRQFALRRAHRYGKQLAMTDNLAPSSIVFNPAVCRAIGLLREDLDLTASLTDYFARIKQAGHTVAVALDAYVHCE